jgi:hypothetical protein
MKTTKLLAPTEYEAGLPNRIKKLVEKVLNERGNDSAEEELEKISKRYDFTTRVEEVCSFTCDNPVISGKKNFEIKGTEEIYDFIDKDEPSSLLEAKEQGVEWDYETDRFCGTFQWGKWENDYKVSVEINGLTTFGERELNARREQGLKGKTT